MKTPEPEANKDGRPSGLAVAPCSASEAKEFRQQIIGEWVDYYPKDGERCEYQINVGTWIPCEIIREYRRGPTQYLARYVSHTGQLKTGVVGSCNLRASSPNTMDTQTPPVAPLALAPCSARLTWECTSPSPNQIWALGELVDQAGKPAQLKNVVAFTQRTAIGYWRWIVYVGGGTRWGFEPSRREAIRAAEAALPNNVLGATE